MSMHMYHYFIEDRKDIPKSSPFAFWIAAMVNPQWLELCLPMSETNFHGPSKAIIALDKAIFQPKITGPSCSKLTTSLVNDSLKFTSSDTQIC